MIEKKPGKLNISADLKEKLSNLCMSKVVKKEESNTKTLVSTVNPSVKHSKPNQSKSIPPPPPPPIPMKKEVTPPPSPILLKDESKPKIIIQEKETQEHCNEDDDLRNRGVILNKSIIDKKLEELGVKIIEREINNLNKETRIIFLLGMLSVILFTNFLLMTYLII